jgi:hypothetical protein
MIKKILFLLFISFIVVSCKHELENPSWETDMIVPIAHAEINISDIVEQTDYSSNLDLGTDSLINLVYSTELFGSDYDSLLNINTVTEQNVSKVADINFKDINISDTITIGSVISEIPLGTILFPDGGNASIPAFTGVSEDDTTLIDGSEYFETMTLSNGYLVITITNNFPTDLANVHIILLNEINLSTIADFTYPLIPSGTSLADSVDISGQTLDKNIIAIIENMDLNASNGSVGINYEDAIITTISLTQLVINQATAFFPEQEISETLKEVSVIIGDAQLREIKIKKGEVKMIVLSTLPDTGRIYYNIPSLTKNGVPFVSENVIPPTQFGEWTTITHNFDGYILDMTGKEDREGGDTTNTIYTEMFAFIDSTGELVTLNEMDSFCSYVELTFVPEYAKGYIGSDTFIVDPKTTTTDALNKIISGSLDLNEVSLNLNIENSIGADAAIIFTELNTDNTNDNLPAVSATTDQNGNIVIGTNYNINRASLDNGELPITPTNTSISLNAADMIEIFPNQATIGCNIYLNPSGPHTTEDFIYTDYTINASIDATVPLSFIANNLTISGTISADLSSDEEIEIDELYITLINGFPLSAKIDIILMDEYYNVIDTLFNNTNIESANTDEFNKVTSPKQTVLTINNTNFDNVKNVKVISSFTTSSLTEHVNIYSYYSMDVSLSARFKQIIGK